MLARVGGGRQLSKAVDQGGDASGIGKDGVPVFEGAIGGDDDPAPFVTTIYDFEEQVGSTGVVREITNFVKAEELGTAGPRPCSPANSRLLIGTLTWAMTQTVADALLDRLLSTAHRLELKG